MSDNTRAFHELSYELHEKVNKREGDSLSSHHQTWFQKDTVDYWRHMRMYKPVTPLVKYYPNTKWITIGDGHYGLDSIRLKEMEPSIDVLPTDISPGCLEFALSKGMISKFEQVNAEKIPYKDVYFDFAFCKESFHHFPRPYAAVYEMLRVSGKAIIFLEPNDITDQPIPVRIIINIKQLLKRLIGKKNFHIDTWSYEPSGNYVYGLSKRELEKIALGLNLPVVAYYYYNDLYEGGVEYEKVGSNSKLFKRLKLKLRISNVLCRLGLLTYNKMNAIIFKYPPPDDLVHSLKESGFKFIYLPRNPYVKG